MTATAAEPTLEEQVRALKETAARLAAERDAAFQMASQATKDQDRERREFEGRLKVRDALIDSLRINADRINADVRRLNARVRELALADEDKQRQLEATQQESETPTPRRRSLKRAGNRKDRS